MDRRVESFFNGFFPWHYSNVSYKGLPQELIPFSYWFSDSGLTILAIPLCFYEEAEKNGEYGMFLAPISTTYVAEKGYKMKNGYPICNVPYDSKYGVGGNDKEFWNNYGECFEVEKAVEAWEKRK